MAALKPYTIPYNCCAIRTTEAKGVVTEQVTKELSFIADQINMLKERPAQIIKLQELTSLEKISAATRKFLDLTVLREIQHFHFMDYILSEKICEFTKDVWKKRRTHDYSKDILFYFAVAAFFDGNVQTEVMKEIKDRELKRHYKLEAHHPEFEMYNERECSEIDIIEMGVDRLARNVQFGNGRVNMDVLIKFMPVFPKGDSLAKQKIMLKYVEKYNKVVQDAFHEMFPDSVRWL